MKDGRPFDAARYCGGRRAMFAPKFAVIWRWNASIRGIGAKA
jgi:hypothetical protein